MLKILNNLLSIQNSIDKKHKVITILGIKFKFKNKFNVPINVPYEKLRMVEIEIFSYCNRRCWFCPNSVIDRHSKNILMDENLYLKILNDLREINYSKMISYSRYNEPLSHIDIFEKRLKQAREYLPNALLHTNTNGDYLSREVLDRLYNAGLRSMNIQCYLNQNEKFNCEDIKLRNNKMAEKLKLEYKVICNYTDRYEVKFDYKDMNLNMYARDFHINGTNRAGILKSIKNNSREVPCYIPFTDLYIDYNGAVVPCCNFRSDIQEHQKFVYGNANNESILKIFNNRKIRNLRTILKHKKIKDLYPCNECNFATDYKY